MQPDKEIRIFDAFDAIAVVSALARECCGQRELIRVLTARVKELTAEVQKPIAAERGVPE